MDDKPKRTPSGSTPLTVAEIVRHAMTDPSQSEALKMAAALVAKPLAGAEAAEQKAVQELERLARLGFADSLSGVGPRLRELISQQSQPVSYPRISDPLMGPDFRPIADLYSHDQHIRRAEEEERARLRVRDEWEAKKAQTQTLVAAPAVPVESEQSTQVGADEIDFSELATREQLITAFGRFTGMDASWFKNLADSPALLTARKHKGQGGRGHIDEPRFCPFAVMCWLANPKRRKGRPLSAEKAWELLEKYFPKSYGRNSVADPRNPD